MKDCELNNTYVKADKDTFEALKRRVLKPSSTTIIIDSGYFSIYNGIIFQDTKVSIGTDFTQIYYIKDKDYFTDVEPKEECKHLNIDSMRGTGVGRCRDCGEAVTAPEDMPDFSQFDKQTNTISIKDDNGVEYEVPDNVIILEVNHGKAFGRIHHTDFKWIACHIDNRGMLSHKYGSLQLKPKQEWWEIESNFPCLLIDEDGDGFYEKYPLNAGTIVLLKTDMLRLTTLEERNSLHVAEDMED